MSQMRQNLHGEIWWSGRQWAVTAHGIERLGGGGKYFPYTIDKDRLLEGVAEWPWPRHMAEKDWVDLDDFITAWLVAFILHDVLVSSTVVRTAIECARQRTLVD